MASNANDERISRAIFEALNSDTPPTAAAPGLAPTADLKQLFCDNWDMVKTVLGFLRKLAPPVLRPVIDIVIKIGDAVKAAICN
jgi:hypothetical protein